MIQAVRGALLVAAVLALSAAGLRGAGLEPGTNVAGVIDFPTALDQPRTHTVHGTVDVFDIGEPDLRPLNLRYGFQVGNLQVLTDLVWSSQPRAFDHGELKLKLRILNLDEFRTHAALGVLGRAVDKKEKEATVIDGKPYSLFAIVTTELYLFRDWDAFLVNFYLDNRFASIGAKLPVYQFIKAVLESDYHHAIPGDDRWHHKAGFELEGEQNFYIQFVYSSVGERMRIQIGTGF
jgi:hypothetical protein